MALRRGVSAPPEGVGQKGGSTQTKTIGSSGFDKCKNRLKPCAPNWETGFLLLTLSAKQMHTMEGGDIVTTL